MSVKKAKKIYDKWSMIDSNDDLRRNKLTLEEYHVLTDILRELLHDKKPQTLCFYGGIAAWCRKQGMTVIDPHGYELNYTISLP